MNAMLQARIPDATPWLSSADIARVRAQFGHVAADADGFAIDFYDALFAIAPLVRAMFRGPMPEQRGKLVRMLSLLIAKLDTPEALEAPLAELGKRHLRYGVLPLDYDCVGEALLRALALRLGEDFDPASKAAWGKVYVFAASTMQEAASRCGPIDARA